MGSIRAIAIKNRPRVAMQDIDSAKITVANGILGDFRGTQPQRQITILSESAWSKVCAEIDVCWKVAPIELDAHMRPLRDWCPGEDSNFHDLAVTGT